jgi:CheY-like chemotaxis protein
MGPLEEFETHLQHALVHLYDPTYRPAEVLWAVTGYNPQEGVEVIQAALVRAIEDLKPAPDVPPTARIRRIYEVLSYRYIQELTQEGAAERLGITPRHLRRVQKEAVHVLAQRLWEQSCAQENELQPPEATASDPKSPQWRAQVREELASLQKSAPSIVANVGEAIRGAVELGSALTSTRGVSLEVERVQPNVAVAAHPSALRQVLITAIGQLARYMSSGRIMIRAEREEERVKITIAGHPAAVDRPPNSDLIREILAVHRGSVETSIDGDRFSFQVELPSADRITVLVVDDNLDLLHFYRRYTTGTRYHIVHVAQGERVFETIEACTPDIIVLDVMLPDVDGWEVLAYLHEHPATRSIPIIVCSVVRENELALALGAAFYLPKPVRRRQFIQALDRVFSQASTRALTPQANNAATC